jgi:hypothetical protein
MIVPPIVNRREIDRNLVLFFRQHRAGAFRRAISDFCRYYNVKRPAIEWFEYLDWGKTAGKTFEDGRIHLVHPENWKRGRVYNKERMWIAMVYHEMGHYLFWTDAERKADAFAFRMVRGLRRPQRRTRPRTRLHGQLHGRLQMTGRTARRTAAAPRRVSPSPRRTSSSIRRVSPPVRRRRSASAPRLIFYRPALAPLMSRRDTRMGGYMAAMM